MVLDTSSSKWRGSSCSAPLRHVFRAFEADLKLFGQSAFQKPLPEDEPPK
jgi:hypothetical protein